MTPMEPMKPMKPMEPMEPMKPMTMGNMSASANPMEMRMGDMYMRMGEESEPQFKPKQRFCTECGNSVKASDRFCASCGHKLGD